MVLEGDEDRRELEGVLVVVFMEFERNKGLQKMKRAMAEKGEIGVEVKCF